MFLVICLINIIFGYNLVLVYIVKEEILRYEKNNKINCNILFLWYDLIIILIMIKFFLWWFDNSIYLVKVCKCVLFLVNCLCGNMYNVNSFL